MDKGCGTVATYVVVAFSGLFGLFKQKAPKVMGVRSNLPKDALPPAKRVVPACLKTRSGMPTGWSRFAISLILPRNLTDFAVQSH